MPVVRPRHDSPSVGTYAAPASGPDLQAIARWDREPVTFDLLGPVTDPNVRERLAIADRLADAVRSTPLAVATFRAVPLGAAPSGLLRIALTVTAGGAQIVAFELDPRASAVLFAGPGGPVSRQALPELHMGFLTAEGDWIGGLGGRGSAEPGATGAIAIDVPAAAGASTVAISVAGMLYDGLPDEPLPRAFAVRTAEASLSD